MPSPQIPQQPDPIQHLIQCASGYVPSSALWVVAELKVADLLADGPRAIAELAGRTQTNEDALYRVLRLLAMVGIFAESEPRHFTLTPAADLLRVDAANSMRDMVLWIGDPLHFDIAGHLLHSVKTGQPTIEHVTGKGSWDYFAAEPVEFDRFHRAMTNMSAIAVAAVLDVYDYSPFYSIVDVAGGHGALICSILQRYAQLNGILFDLDAVIGGARQRIHELGLDARCATIAGDFFAAVPDGGDLYMMKSIIHDWDDERALVILRNCREALRDRPNGRLVLVEFVVPQGNQPHASKIIDIEMLFFTGGRERTEPEFETLLGKAGFRLTRVLPTRSAFSVIEAEVV